MLKPAIRLVANDPEPTDGPDYTYEMWAEDLRGIAWNSFIKGRLSMEDIAVMSGLRQNTVESFIWGVTKSPRATTVYQIARAVGFRSPWIPENAPVQPAERDYAAYRKSLPSAPGRK